MKKIILALLATAAMAMAESHTHDGFFLNLALGFGYGNFEDNYTSVYNGKNRLESSGTSTEFDFKIGGSVVHNVALHFSALGVGFFNDIDMYKEGQFNKSVSPESFNLSLVGGGVTAYIPAVDGLFVSASIGATQYSRSLSNGLFTYEAASVAGFGFAIQAGKEWWVSDNWGLGLSVSYIHGNSEDSNNLQKEDMHSNSFNVMFSATFN